MGAETTAVIDSGTAFSVAGLLYLLVAGSAAVHVLLNKHNVGATVSWIGVIVLSPFFGAVLYWLFGVNRIKRRVQAEMEGRGKEGVKSGSAKQHIANGQFEREDHLSQLFQTGLSIHYAPYLNNNSVEILNNGVEAFPSMISAIENATHSVVLSSYIFEYDAVGRQFVTALSNAHARGVSVQVLIDGVGIGYGFSLAKSDRVLRKNSVATARFLPTFSAFSTRFINLRNHRKILSVDGQVAFVGGMNIRAGNLLTGKLKHQTQDVHFKFTGPVINQINDVFAEDWQFATGDALSLPAWQGNEPGKVVSRVLPDGPDDNYKKLELTLIAAINVARRSIDIVTPYFLPDDAVIQALRLAVLRGVVVRLVVPARNNLFFVDMAMKANEKTVLGAGIKIYRTQPPFDHSKLFIVDSHYCLVGSSNWDARSLELNFEINLECYNAGLVKQLETVVGNKLESAELVTLVTRPLLIRLRNNFFRLFTPYL